MLSFADFYYPQSQQYLQQHAGWEVKQIKCQLHTGILLIIEGEGNEPCSVY